LTDRCVGRHGLFFKKCLSLDFLSGFFRSVPLQQTFSGAELHVGRLLKQHATVSA
jgi:hypothetical protein